MKAEWQIQDMGQLIKEQDNQLKLLMGLLSAVRGWKQRESDDNRHALDVALQACEGL